MRVPFTIVSGTRATTMHYNIRTHIGSKHMMAVIATVAVLLLTGCGEYQKLLKSKDPDQKYQAALRYFNDGQ